MCGNIRFENATEQIQKPVKFEDDNRTAQAQVLQRLAQYESRVSAGVLAIPNY